MTMFGDYHNPNDFWRHHWMPKDMNDDDRIAMGILQGVIIFIMLMGGLLLCAFFGSCTTERVVTVEKVRTDTLRENHTQRDSIYIHDSTLVKEKGDTVWVERWHTQYRDRWHHDSVYIAKTDSVPVPYPVIKEVEKPLSATQKGLIAIGLVTLMAGIVWVAFRVKRWLP